MTWRIPGQPFDIVVDGVRMKCKALTRGERLDLAKKAQGLKAGTSADLDAFYDTLSGLIISIDQLAPEVTPAQALEYQGADFMLSLFNAVMGESGVPDELEKNSVSSSAISSPVPAREIVGDVTDINASQKGT